MQSRITFSLLLALTTALSLGSGVAFGNQGKGELRSKSKKYLAQQNNYPPQQGSYPGQQGGYAPQQGGYPAQQGGYMPPQGGYPAQPGGYPAQQNGYSAPQGGYPAQGYQPQQGAYAPQQSGYPSPQGNFQQGGYPNQQASFQPQQGSYPMQQASYPNQQGAYQSQSGYPQQGGFPQQGNHGSAQGQQGFPGGAKGMQKSSASPQQAAKVYQWFLKYDEIRRRAQMNPIEKQQADGLLARGLSLFMPGQDKLAGKQLLSGLVIRYQTATQSMQSLQVLPETKKLQEAYYQYFETAMRLFQDYLKVQDNLFAVDNTGQSIAKQLIQRKAELENLEHMCKELDAQTRSAYGVAAYQF